MTKMNGAETSSEGRSRWKLWVLAALLLLATWSMFAGSLTLEWAAAHLVRSSSTGDLHLVEEIDILEVEEKEKVVRHLWDLYSDGGAGSRLPPFWSEAFSAAYEELTSGIPSVRDAAISEIAKFSIRSALQNSISSATTSSLSKDATPKPKKEKA